MDGSLQFFNCSPSSMKSFWNETNESRQFLSTSRISTIDIHHECRKLTKQLNFLSMQMYIFGRLREWLITMGSVGVISLSISGGAEAVRAMKGALVSARRPPICWNALRKVSPLYKTSEMDVPIACSYINSGILSSNHSWMQCASSTATDTRWLL